MKRGVTVEYVIAVVAILVAVWAVVQVGKKANVADLAATERYLKETRDHLIETRGMLIDTNDLVIDLKRQVADIEKIVNGSGLTLEQLGEVREQILDLEAVAKYIGDCIGEDIFPDDLPPVHRTTSHKPRPEVRNIDPTPDRSGP